MEVAFRSGLAVLNVFRRGDMLEAIPHAGGVENELDFVPQCPGHDRQAITARRILDELHDVRIHHPGRREVAEHQRRFPLDESLNRRRRSGTAVFGEDGVKAALVVETDILLVIVAFAEREPFFLQDLLEHRAVERLGIREDPVEIEDDGFQHVRRSTFQ